MGALNEACRSNGGKIKTVIHHMCVRPSDHPPVFPSTPHNPHPTNRPRHQYMNMEICRWVIDKMEFTDVDELVIAKGDNLQERKRLLWETCDCVVVLPGGTGACVCG